MVYRIFVEKKGRIRPRGEEPPFGRAGASGAFRHRAHPHHQPLRRGGHRKIALRRLRQDGVFRTADGTGRRNTSTLRAPEYSPWKYLPGAVRSARRFGRAVHPARLQRGASPSCARQSSMRCTGDVSDEALSALKKVCHQPRGEPRGEPRSPRNAAYFAPRSLRSGDAPRLFCRWKGRRFLPLLRSTPSRWTRDDIRFCRDYFRKEGRDPTLTEIRNDRHLLVRSLPPHPPF